MTTKKNMTMWLEMFIGIFVKNMESNAKTNGGTTTPTLFMKTMTLKYCGILTHTQIRRPHAEDIVMIDKKDKSQDY